MAERATGRHTRSRFAVTEYQATRLPEKRKSDGDDCVRVCVFVCVWFEAGGGVLCATHVYTWDLHCSGILTLKMGTTGWPETLVRNFHHTLRNIPEERRSLSSRGGSLKSRISIRLLFMRLLVSYNWQYQHDKRAKFRIGRYNSVTCFFFF